MRPASVLLLLLLALGGAAALFVPSYGVETCRSDDDATCETKLLVRAYVLPATQGVWELEFEVAEGLTVSDDESGVEFVVAEPVRLRLSAANERLEVDLEHEGSVRNAYVERGTIPSSEGCPHASSCCDEGGADRAIYTVRQNATELLRHRAVSERFRYDVLVEAGGEELRLSDSAAVAHGAAVDAYLVDATPTASLAGLSAFSVLADAAAPAASGAMVVPSFVFGTSQNQVGLDPDALFRSRSQCGLPLYEYTEVSGSGAHDQLAGFRDDDTDAVWRCAADDARSDLGNLDEPSLVVVCEDKPAAYELLLELRASSFRIVKLVGTPRVLETGVLPVEPGDEELTVFVDVANVGDFRGLFEVRLTSCTADFADEPMGDDIISGSVFPSQFANIIPRQTRRVEFVLEPTIVHRIVGSCGVAIYQYGERDLVDIVEFDTTIFDYTPPDDSPDNPNPTPNPDTGECDAPLTISEATGLCVSQCREDEMFVETACLPVACASKYGTERPVFDFEARACVAQGGSGGDTGGGGNGTDPGPDDGFDNLGDLFDSIQGGTPNCSGHGTVNDDNRTCTCDEGFTTDPDQNLVDYRWCSIQFFPNTGGSGSTLQLNAGLVLNGIVLALLLLVCCRCALKCRSSRARKKRQAARRRKRRGDNDSDSSSSSSSDSDSDAPPPPRKRKPKQPRRATAVLAHQPSASNACPAGAVAAGVDDEDLVWSDVERQEAPAYT